jgi:polyphosphate glucokinase
LATTRLGIDIGASGIKAGIVDLDRGVLISDRVRVPTPQPSLPHAVAEAVAAAIEGLGYQGPIGIGFPSVVIEGVVITANNIDPSWIGTDAGTMFGDTLGTDVEIVNDADAAALCEAGYGAARGVPGVVLLLTFGTGIGGGLLNDGVLVPNLQIGDIELDGHRPAETYFSAAAKTREGLSWEEWATRANRFVGHVKVVFSPRLVILGGGLIRQWDQWSPFLHPALGVVPATRANNAGIVGAATLVGQRA